MRRVAGLQRAHRRDQREVRRCLQLAGAAGLPDQRRQRVVRYAFDSSSNAWLEMQWYLFAAIVMLGASYTLKRNEHVRVDLLYMTLSRRGQLWIDIVGTSSSCCRPASSCLAVAGRSSCSPSTSTRFVERRRPAALAGQVPAAAGLRPARLQGLSESSSASRCAQRTSVEASKPTTRGRCNDPIGVDAAADVRRAGGLHADRLPGRLLAGGGRAVLRLHRRSSSGFFTIGLPAGHPAPRVRHPVQRPAARDPVLHLHGRHPGDAAAWPRTCWKAPASCSARSAAASAMRSSSSAPSWAPSPARSRPGHRHGLISLPVMMRYGYDMRYATGVIAASGTITQLIPPSLVLIVLADQLGRSVGDMYSGASGPSLLQIALFAALHLRPQHRQAAMRAGAAAGAAHAARLAAVEQVPVGHRARRSC